MTSFQFFHATGRMPEQDDLDRVNCTNAGEAGHAYCGWCVLCDAPRFNCENPADHRPAFETRVARFMRRLADSR